MALGRHHVLPALLGLKSALPLQAPAWSGTPGWIHSDLLRPNLLVHDGRLCAVIDFGAAGVGDPAADVTAA
jgi:aminoglycoside phosphotransferase (APT) family kinase protein